MLVYGHGYAPAPSPAPQVQTGVVNTHQVTTTSNDQDQTHHGGGFNLPFSNFNYYQQGTAGAAGGISMLLVLLVSLGCCYLLWKSCRKALCGCCCSCLEKHADASARVADAGAGAIEQLGAMSETSFQALGARLAQIHPAAGTASHAGFPSALPTTAGLLALAPPTPAPQPPPPSYFAVHHQPLHPLGLPGAAPPPSVASSAPTSLQDAAGGAPHVYEPLNPDPGMPKHSATLQALTAARLRALEAASLNK